MKSNEVRFFICISHLEVKVKLTPEKKKKEKRTNPSVADCKLVWRGGGNSLITEDKKSSISQMSHQLCLPENDMEDPGVLSGHYVTKRIVIYHN